MKIIRELIHHWRVMSAIWLLNKMIKLAPDPEKNLFLQGGYLITKALTENRQNLEAVIWTKAGAVHTEGITK